MRADEYGLSLLELIVAFFVVQVAFMGGVQLVGSGLDFQNSARNQSYAALLAQEKIEELMIGGVGQYQRDGGALSGIKEARLSRIPDAPSSKFNWAIDLKDSGLGSGLKEAKVTIAWVEGKRGRRLDLVSIVSP